MVKCKKCDKWATFGPIGSSIAEYCAVHKPPGYENVVGKRCKHLDCKTRPTFGPIGGSQKDAEYCKDHKPPGYINVKDKRCKLCDTIPTFGPIGGSKKDAEYCADHKPLGYENVCNKRCKHQDCKTTPTFGPIGGSQKDAEYCKDHKPSGYVDVCNKRCKLCDTKPTFGPIGGSQKDAEYCKDHKPPGYADVCSKRCKLCDTQPSYGLIGGSKKDAEYCKDHKPAFGYVNVVSKRCKLCDTIPTFGPIGGSKKDAEYCANHKPPGYENIKKKCQHPDCKKNPWYGFLGRTTSHCAQHKKSFMIPNPIKRCHKCKKIATYLRDKLYYCDTCDNNALDSIEIGNTCLACRVTSIADNPDRDVIHCAGCIEDIKAGKITQPAPKRIKEKENRIFKLIIENGYFAIQDSIINEGCVGSSKRRPDIRLFANWGPLIIEVDENQHRNYTSSCNYKRLNDIYEDIDNEKMVVIRYNPDNYKPFPGYKPASHSERETTLLKHIEEFMSKEATQIPSGINILHLYYDFFNPITQPILLFDPVKYVKHMAKNNDDDSTFKLE